MKFYFCRFEPYRTTSFKYFIICNVSLQGTFKGQSCLKIDKCMASCQKAVILYGVDSNPAFTIQYTTLLTRQYFRCQFFFGIMSSTKIFKTRASIYI